MYYKYVVTLIITVLLGLVIAYFATQNTTATTINFLYYSIPGIPVYLIVIGALLLGLLLSWLISIMNGIGTGLSMRGKESKIKDYRKENAELSKRIHQLELDNAHLSEKTKSAQDHRSL